MTGNNGARSLLGIEQVGAPQILRWLEMARRMERSRRPQPVLRDARIALLFYEASTRTRVSFEFAAKALGASTSVINASASSIEKGESLIDTGYTLQSLGVNAIVIRHPSSGAPHVLARHVDIPVINAGDGMHEHPTQALLDAFTILRHKKKIKGLRVAIVGDVQHSRVARSNFWLLRKLGAQVVLCGPPSLLPHDAIGLAPDLEITPVIEEAVRGADVVMMLRVQKERLAGVSLDHESYVAGYQLTPQRLAMARRDAIVMHPGPMVRGMELTGEVADGARSVIREQVRAGLYVRMAVLAWAAGKAGR